MAAAAQRLPWRPRTDFEEWDEPMICGIGWVSEMIALAGGTWCRKRFVPERVRARPGWHDLRANRVEIKSADILSPGPAAIERGCPRVLAAIAERTDVPYASLGLPAEWMVPADLKRVSEPP